MANRFIEKQNRSCGLCFSRKSWKPETGEYATSKLKEMGEELRALKSGNFSSLSELKYISLGFLNLFKK